jgi:hypothetical protein
VPHARGVSLSDDASGALKITLAEPASSGLPEVTAQAQSDPRNLRADKGNDYPRCRAYSERRLSAAAAAASGLAQPGRAGRVSARARGRIVWRGW